MLEPGLPELAVVFQPLADVCERLGFKPARPALCVLAVLIQAGPL